MATALGVCMSTVMGIFAEKNGIDLRGLKVTVQKEMTQVPVRRISRLTVELVFPPPPTHPHRATLERIALTCPVYESLHPEMEKPVTFVWAGGGGAGVVISGSVVQCSVFGNRCSRPRAMRCAGLNTGYFPTTACLTNSRRYKRPACRPKSRMD